jgi:transmembrane 9 superfamily protein 2/4
MRAPEMLRWLAAAAALVALLAAAPAAGFYLPGVAPTDFGKVRIAALIPSPSSSS